MEDLICPDSPDGGVLNIRWQQPSSNAPGVNDYVVEVQEIIHSPPGSRMLGFQTLAPPFRQEVQSGDALITAVTSGAGEWAVGRPYDNVSTACMGRYTGSSFLVASSQALPRPFTE